MAGYVPDATPSFAPSSTERRTAMPPAPPCKAITPQIAWHGKEPVLSIDVSVTGFVATGGADNEVVLWRLRLNKEPGEAVCWVQTLTGIHNKVGAASNPPDPV